MNSREKKLAEQANEYLIEVDSYKISVLHWQAKSDSVANADAKSTVLCTHGWAGHALNFTTIIEELCVQGHDVVAYDSPAHGNSTGKRTTLLANTQALLKVAEQMGPIDILVGHSFGCLANVFALDLGNDVASLADVKKLILIAGPNKLTDLFSSFTTTMHLPESVLQIFFNKVEALVHRPIESISVEGLLKKITAEVLIIHDKRDRIVPIQEAENISKQTHAQLFLTNGYGHSRILSAGSVLSKINEFTHI